MINLLYKTILSFQKKKMNAWVKYTLKSLLQILIVISMSGLTHAENQIVSINGMNGINDMKIINNKWEKISNSCSIKKVKITRKNTGSEFDLFFIKFNPEKIKIKILVAKNLGVKIQTASLLAQKSKAFCVINAGFFDENYNPLGVLISNGKLIQPMPEYGNFAIFCIKNGNPAIIHLRDFTYEGVTQAIQCSPRLLADGYDTYGVQQLNKLSRRSGIGLDYENNVIIYATDTIFDGLSFNELRAIFKLKDINLKNVLSLDGGKSTQLYLNLNNYKIYNFRSTQIINIPGYEDIPVGIGFF